MIHSLCAGWNQFWFAPRAAKRTTLPRMAICTVAAAWMLSFLFSADAWFSDQGWLSRSLAASLIDADQTPTWQQWSPLWWTGSSTVISIWLVIGIGIALLAATGFGGRLTLGILLFWIVSWIHRIVWLQGPLEPALVAGVAYLLFQPGATLWRLNAAASQATTWTAGVSLRLLQTHWWLLVAAGVLSQLANLTWWRGEAVWWLASAGRSNLLSTALLSDNPALTNALTHGAIVVQLLALWLVSVRSARGIGVLFGIAVSLVYGGLADQLLYAVLLASFLTAFVSQIADDAQAGTG
jgi:hypothetical protein